MQPLIQKFGALLKKLGIKFWGFSVLYRALITLALLIVIGLSLHFTGTKREEAAVTKADRGVKVLSVAALEKETSPLPLLGTVTSRSEATIRTEGSGKLNMVYKGLGDYVDPGTVIAAFENSSERAGVLQAEGAYESALAGRDIASINRSSSDTSLTLAKTSALNVINAAYTTLDDAIRTKTDPAWRNPQTAEAKLSVTIPDAKLIINLEEERIALETLLRTRSVRNKALSESANLVAELDTVETEIKTVSDYLDDLSRGLNHGIADGNAAQSAIDSYKVNTGIARAAASGVLTAVTGSRTALALSLSANAVAEKNSSTKTDGATTASEGQLKSALGNLRAAEARLEKTIIRSPIQGTINSLSVHTGDFVPAFTQVAIVSNNGALEVIAYVTEDDAQVLMVGSKVAIEGVGVGVITRIAPALDPKTKKIEVRIGIMSGGAALVNGQSVQMEATRIEKAARSEDKVHIPLSALKITPNGAVVFTVNASSTLVAHKVKEGALLGENIEIAEGLTQDMVIVVDARGLKEGMSVTLTK